MTGRPKLTSLNENGITALQQRFVEEYVIDLCATEAAKRAGYAKTSAHSSGHDLLKKPEINSAIKKELAKLKERTHISQEWVIEQLKLNYKRAVESGEGSVANRALELIGKHMQMFPEKVKAELSGPDGGAIRIRAAADMSDDELAIIASEEDGPSRLESHSEEKVDANSDM